MCLIRDIRTNRYYDNIIITLLYNYYNGIGILLKKCLILPILIHRRNYPALWVFSLVVVWQMGVSATTPTSYEVKTSAIFLILTHRRNT